MQDRRYEFKMTDADILLLMEPMKTRAKKVMFLVKTKKYTFGREVSFSFVIGFLKNEWTELF